MSIDIFHLVLDSRLWSKSYPCPYKSEISNLFTRDLGLRLNFEDIEKRLELSAQFSDCHCSGLYKSNELLQNYG
jgi:hypothetical protein